jgi:hypothetical protein
MACTIICETVRNQIRHQSLIRIHNISCHASALNKYRTVLIRLLFLGSPPSCPAIKPEPQQDRKEEEMEEEEEEEEEELDEDEESFEDIKATDDENNF